MSVLKFRREGLHAMMNVPLVSIGVRAWPPTPISELRGGPEAFKERGVATSNWPRSSRVIAIFEGSGGEGRKPSRDDSQRKQCGG